MLHYAWLTEGELSFQLGNLQPATLLSLELHRGLGKDDYSNAKDDSHGHNECKCLVKFHSRQSSNRGKGFKTKAWMLFYASVNNATLWNGAFKDIYTGICNLTAVQENLA